MAHPTYRLFAGVKSEPLFPTEAAYEKFRESFQKDVRPELDRQREARRQSEEDAKKHLVL